MVHHPGMRMIATAALLLGMCPTGALACSLAPNNRPPSQAQLDRGLRIGFQRAEAVAEVMTVRGSQLGQPGLMRILRVYKGNIRVGAVYPLHAVPESMCGSGDFRPGLRGVMMIGRIDAPISYSGFLIPDEMSRLRRFGLIRVN
jgi:hypothetical protein